MYACAMIVILQTTKIRKTQHLFCFNKTVREWIRHIFWFGIFSFCYGTVNRCVKVFDFFFFGIAFLHVCFFHRFFSSSKQTKLNYAMFYSEIISSPLLFAKKKEITFHLMKVERKRNIGENLYRQCAQKWNYLFAFVLRRISKLNWLSQPNWYAIEFNWFRSYSFVIRLKLFAR